MISSETLPKITFGIIVFNGEPFTRYCLRSLYPFAHEIIVVEGACTGAASLASAEGHSTDGTLEQLYRFQKEEDPEKKVQIVTRQSFWSEKDEQSRAYTERATGDYIWQVDIDEFYKEEDLLKVIAMLRRDPAITAISFRQITFWGGFEYIADSWYLRAGAHYYHRVFKWGKGFEYVTHRPPTVVDSNGRNVRDIKWLTGETMDRHGIYLYHYSLVFPKQVMEKCEYHKNRDSERYWAGPAWAENVFRQLKNPYRVHNVYTHPSWLEPFEGTHPAQIESLRADIRNGIVQIQLRQNADVQRLLRSRRYRIGRTWLKVIFPFVHTFSPVWNRFTYVVTHPGRAAAGLMKRATRLFQHS